jgi:hypothetical protein
MLKREDERNKERNKERKKRKEYRNKRNDSPDNPSLVLSVTMPPPIICKYSS